MPVCVGNEDRHLNNFGVLWNAVTGEFLEAPLFDNGLGLFEHDSIYDGLHLVQAFARDLEKTVDAIDISSLKLVGKIIHTSDLVFPNQLAKPYFMHAAQHLGIEVV